METNRCLEGKLAKIEAHSLTVFGTNVKGVRSLTVENVKKYIILPPKYIKYLLVCVPKYVFI